MSLNNRNNMLVDSIFIGSLTADKTIPIIHFPRKVDLVSAHIINGAAISASNTVYANLKLKRGTTVIAEYDSRAANQGALTANIAAAMALVAGQEAQAAGSDLSLVYDESGTAAALTIGSLVFTAVTAGVAGNSITMRYVNDGVAGSETVSVSGTAITVHVDTTPVTGSTQAQVKTALLASAAAMVLIGVTGTAATVVTATGPTNLTGGSDSNAGIALTNAVLALAYVPR
jgi:hypothetical protein